MWHLYNPLPISVKKKIIVIGNSSLVCGSSNQKAIAPDWTKSLREFHLSSVSLFKSRFHFQSWFYFQKSVLFSKADHCWLSKISQRIPSFVLKSVSLSKVDFTFKSQFHFQKPITADWAKALRGFPLPAWKSVSLSGSSFPWKRWSGARIVIFTEPKVQSGRTLKSGDFQFNKCFYRTLSQKLKCIQLTFSFSVNRHFKCLIVECS